jgi:hypothetical protein
MGHLRRYTLLLVLLAGSLTPAHSAPASRPADERLEQKVTFEVVGEPLEVVLRRLSQQTGVSFTFEGRAVGDRKAIVLVRDVPLKELKDTLAATFFGYRWREEKRKRNEPVEYILFQDVRSRQIEAALRSAPEQQRMHRLGQLLAGLRNGGRDLDEEGQRLLRDAGTHTALEALAGLTPGQMRVLFTNNYLRSNLQLDRLSPEQEKHWSLWVGAQVESVRRRASGVPEVLSITDAKPFPLHELPDAAFNLAFHEDDDGSSFLDLALNSSIVAHQAPGLALAFSRVPLSQSVGKEAARVPDLQEFLTPKRSESAAQQDSDLQRRVRAPTGKDEKAPRPASYSYLFGPYWARWVVPLARWVEFPVVSDYYTDGVKSPTKDVIGMTLRQALDEGCRAFERRWMKHGPIYSFRYEKWYLAAPAEPPQRVLDALQAAVDRKGRLDLEDLAVGGELNRQQLGRASALKLPYFWIFRDHYPTMRLLNALTQPQRAMAQANGFTMGTLSSPTAREWFKTAAWSVMPRLAEAEMNRVVLRIASEVDVKNHLTLTFDWRGPEGQKGSEQARLEVGQKG